MKGISKEEALTMLREYILTGTGLLPIKDAVVSEEMVGNELVVYTFRGLLKYAYNLKESSE